jgi:hypothetical protein
MSRKPSLHFRMQLTEEHCCSLKSSPVHTVLYIFSYVLFLWIFLPRFFCIWCGNVCIETLQFFSLQDPSDVSLVLVITSVFTKPCVVPHLTYSTKHTGCSCCIICTLYCPIRRNSHQISPEFVWLTTWRANNDPACKRLYFTSKDFQNSLISYASIHIPFHCYICDRFSSIFEVYRRRLLVVKRWHIKIRFCQECLIPVTLCTLPS